MIIVVDASVLVAELLRARGRELLASTDLQCVVAEDQWAETEHELEKRLVLLTDRGRLTGEQAAHLREGVREFVESGALDVVPRSAYERFEPVARRRVPRDPLDWPVVALALALQAGILTGDGDFLGCGCPTWTVDTLRQELTASSRREECSS